jgi:hypothetical protein
MRRLIDEIVVALFVALCLVVGVATLWATFSLLSWLFPVRH